MNTLVILTIDKWHEKRIISIAYRLYLYTFQELIQKSRRGPCGEHEAWTWASSGDYGKALVGVRWESLLSWVAYLFYKIRHIRLFSLHLCLHFSLVDISRLNTRSAAQPNEWWLRHVTLNYIDNYNLQNKIVMNNSKPQILCTHLSWYL